nr:immunoglobulin light chain junction region [Macaca mulatta]
AYYCALYMGSCISVF